MGFKTSSPAAAGLKKDGQILFNKGLSQKEIAKKLGLSERTLSNWVNKGEWKLKSEEKIKDGLSVDFMAFIAIKKPSLVDELEALHREFRNYK